MFIFLRDKQIFSNTHEENNSASYGTCFTYYDQLVRTIIWNLFRSLQQTSIWFQQEMNRRKVFCCFVYKLLAEVSLKLLSVL